MATCRSSSTEDDLLNFTPQSLLISSDQIDCNASGGTDTYKSEYEYNIPQKAIFEIKWRKKRSR